MNVRKIDNELKEYILEGEDKKDVTLLYKAILPQLKKCISQNKGSEEDALDIFQEAVIVFSKNFITNKAELKDNMIGYMYRIAINNWKAQMKAAAQTSSIDEVPPTVEEEHPMGTHNHAIVKQLLDRLGTKCKELLSLSVFADLSQEDIIQRQKFNSVAAVKMQFKRCKKKLMELSKEHPELIKELREIA